MAKLIKREIFAQAEFKLSQFRALCITGPRQSGKTTLSKMLFKDKPYVNFETPSTQAAFLEAPQEFLKKYNKGAIFDEVQRVPLIFRYLQEMLDKNTQRGQYILTGSNNFLLQEQVSQSLAGRAGYLSLLPLSFEEISSAGLPSKTVDELIVNGGYPEIWQEKLQSSVWLESYVQTYVQRDIRLLKNINDLATFSRFVFLCANHAGQLVNREALAKGTGVDTKTIQSWLGLLESSFLVYQLQPWFNNANKRLIKSPKLYFYDTGLLCYLLGIQNKTQLRKHPQYGAIFENWIISEIQKNRINEGDTKPMYFYRDSTGNEVDLLVHKNNELFAVEIKSSTKVDSSMLKGLNHWNKYHPDANTLLIYGGEKADEIKPNQNILPWNQINQF
ncbi:ATP-binding protein [Sediminibacterium sp. TEGAF015]|uniref:ATP-binding protein n=1 Tax=Sediminibacterium sp. TEGAF015 TaxID=575378 RepID=UPI00220BD565|nr:ATP-binding protein [Sediminibacterium sp. TEGAF015]BDQ13255.1 ATPase [Sediminibacterium sp. TEGAF015]